MAVFFVQATQAASAVSKAVAGIGAEVKMVGAGRGSPWYRLLVDIPTAWFRRGSLARIRSLAARYGAQVHAADISTAGVGTVFVRPKASWVEMVEEVIHARQPAEFADEIAHLRSAVAARGLARPFLTVTERAAEELRIAVEIQAKAHLLENASTYELGYIDRWLLRRAVNRLWKYGISRGY